MSPHPLRRYAFAPLAGALSLLFFIRLALAGSPQVLAAGEIINVPGDYPKIQQAIDAAAPGATIVVQEGDFQENLSITKPITISGSNCPLGHGCDDTRIVGNGKRVISITLPVDAGQVTLKGLVVTNGDATAMGGFIAYGRNRNLPLATSISFDVDHHDVGAPLDLSGQFVDLQQQLQRLSEVEHSSPAFQTIEARLDEAMATDPNAVPELAEPAFVAQYPPVVQDGEEIDCGGGLYSRNASLHLVTMDFTDNIASTGGPGLGGGLCVVGAPGGLLFENVRFHQNTAASAVGAFGEGGGAFIFDADLIYSDGRLQENLASSAGPGYGGAVMLAGLGTHTAQLDRIFATAITNTATTASGALGLGGILYVDNMALTLSESQFELGSAGVAGPGAGGAIYIRGGEASPIRIYDNLFNESVASRGIGQSGRGGAIAVYDTVPGAIRIMTNTFSANIAAVSGAGVGGALYLENAPGAFIARNQFETNLAAPNGRLASGGAIATKLSPNAVLMGNRFSGNKGTVGWRTGLTNCAGGAVFAEKSNQFVVVSNSFEDNACAVLGRSIGGALAIIDSRAPQLLANEFARNTNTLFASEGRSPFADAMGGGGAGMARVEGGFVLSNSFSANVAGTSYLGDPGGGKVYQFFRGGGLFVTAVSGMEIGGNVFTGNLGSMLFGGAGGGVALEDAASITFTQNIVTGNQGGIDGFGSGGGLALINNVDGAWIGNNDFVNNQANGVMGSGGGLLAGGLSDDHTVATTRNIVLDSNRFIENRGSPEPHLESYGGAAAFVFVGAITVTNNIMVRNQGGDTGDGLSFWYEEGSGDVPGFFIANNDFYQEGTSIGMLGRPTGAVQIVNTAIISSSGVPIEWGKPAPHGTVSYLLINGGSFSAPASITATQILTAPIRFVAPELLDFHLMPNSAAIDAGDPAGVPPAPPVDIEGTPRPYGKAVDIGAYEWHGQGSFLGGIWKD